MPQRSPSNRPVSRRSFLAGAAGAVAIPQIVPASALGRGGLTAPGDRLVMGCIGVGGMGTQHVVGGVWAPSGGLVGRDDVRVVALCDVNAQRLGNARNLVNQRYGNQDCAAYRDFRELLARKDIDAVLIATGDRWHSPITAAAARAGKHAFCEKPISLTIAEAIQLRETVRRCGTVLQVGTQQRSSHSFRFTCELVRNGYIGQLREVVVGVGGPPVYRDSHLPAEPVPEWLDYDMWLGPAPWRPFNSAYVGGWMAYRDFSGGEMTNWGAHHFDIAQWGVGLERSGPVEIVPPNGRDVRVLTYRYANGVVMTRDTDRTTRESPDGNGVLFVGSEGKIAVWRYDLKTWPEHLKRVQLRPNDIRLHEADNHHTDFIDAIRRGGRAGCDIDTASRSISVCHLGNIAYELGRPVRWDPVRERFVNDAEADRLIARPMRAPWRV
ncbi:MAG TPA: Gfo/Idh/MocA family oxidoreductase [Chthonomonadales bacterium]|nr:Gfo/Idh/MocA family oxidoreductase [Chthonomonadales bacterium]